MPPGAAAGSGAEFDGEPRAVSSTSLYVHVPFCRLVCAYCDFVTVGGRAADIPRYVAALLAELVLRPLTGAPATIYFGGGTPSLLPAEAIARLLAAAGAVGGEITVEANPGVREAPDWAALRAAGVNRLSLGAQSLRDGDLVTLARGHTANEVRGAYRAARQAGFENISIDLIYGIPGQSLDDWRAGLAAAIALEAEHLSLYGLQLALAPDEWAAAPRAGALRWRRRMASRQDDDLAAEQYRAAEDMLASAGYRHYELSSWARAGFESRHNSACWERRPYLGIGAGAHSFDGATRSWNSRDLDEYLCGVEAGERPLAGLETLDEPTRAFEAVALGLRRVAGFSRQAFAAEFGQDPADRFPDAVRQNRQIGLIELTSEQMRLTPAGRLLANEALVAFT